MSQREISISVVESGACWTRFLLHCPPGKGQEGNPGT